MMNGDRSEKILMWIGTGIIGPCVVAGLGWLAYTFDGLRTDVTIIKIDVAQLKQRAGLHDKLVMESR
jgi:hypothetical protein